MFSGEPRDWSTRAKPRSVGHPVGRYWPVLFLHRAGVAQYAARFLPDTAVHHPHDLADGPAEASPGAARGHGREVTRRLARSTFKGPRRWSRPFVVLALCVAAPRAAHGQDPVRPWLDWRTATTRSYRFHFTREMEAWARAAAARVESIDSSIVSLVGYAPPRPIDVVVDDPFSIANGYALPFLDHPVSVWWATPPDPRNDIGNY